jgi:hypothetical protein
MRSCFKKQRSTTNEFFMRPYDGPELRAIIGFKPYNTGSTTKMRIMQRTEHGVPVAREAIDKPPDCELVAVSM